ncbi:MAG: hypothetical protein VYD99_02090, partial [Planctomycetota bacterium]|nr:hypothetical protein [Planctomycetota bacterium]
MARNGSSRTRFEGYRAELREKRDRHRDLKVVSWHSQERSTSRHRSFRTLFGVFLSLLRPYRGAMLVALSTLTVATLLALV